MNRYQINEMLKNYKWKIATVRLTRKELGDAGGKMTAQYGQEAGMPKALNKPGDPVYEEAKRREKQWVKVQRFEDEIKSFQRLLPIITNERDAEVLHWTLEGKSQRWIGKHMGLSATHISRMFDSIITQLEIESKRMSNGANGADVTYVANGANEAKMRKV